MLEYSLEQKSLETRLSSSTSKILPSFFAYSLKVSFTICAEISLCTKTFKSTIETFATGTRSDVPFSLPAKFGRTKFIAFAAPVEVGIMFSAAARERRKSFVLTSTKLCEDV